MAQIYGMLVQTWVRDIVAVAGVFPADPDWANNAVPVPTDADYPTEQYPLWYTTSPGPMPISSSLYIAVHFKYFDAANNQVYGGTADLAGFFFSKPQTSNLPAAARAVWSDGGSFAAAQSNKPYVFNTPPDVRMGVRFTNFAAFGAATKLAISFTRLCPQ